MKRYIPRALITFGCVMMAVGNAVKGNPWLCVMWLVVAIIGAVATIKES